MIYNPHKEFEEKYQKLHFDNTNKFFDSLVQKSGINIEENRKTVKEYNELKDKAPSLKRRLGWLCFFRVLMIITIILIPLVILKLNPKIRALKEKCNFTEQKITELFALANEQMAALNNLLSDRDAFTIIENTIPDISFSPYLSSNQEENMVMNFDFTDTNDNDHSTVEVLTGYYNENPFLFESKLTHKMGIETYHGQLKISWTVTYRDHAGRTQKRTETQILHASVMKPKPFYNTQLTLKYGSQSAPELSFTRDATHLEQKNDKQIDKYIKKGEKKLKQLTDESIKQNKNFMSMANSDFEVLFDALDRNNEVQFRTLFTPLAQTNMVELMRSKTAYGDDFDFIKRKRMSKIIPQHSQKRSVFLRAVAYQSFLFDNVKDAFIQKNTEFFKMLYFDFAPILAIPAYQERPVKSLEPIKNFEQVYSCKEYEALANKVKTKYTVNPRTKTKAILKASFVGSNNGTDEICVTAYSYDTVFRTDYIPVRGGDGYIHNVPVHWNEYIPIQTKNNFFVSTSDRVNPNNIISKRNNLCIFN